MSPCAVVGFIAHDLTIVSINWIGEVVNAWAVLGRAVVGHYGPEFGFGILPSVLIGLARVTIEPIVLASVIVAKFMGELQ